MESPAPPSFGGAAAAKVWLIFPGTKRNLSLMKEMDGLQAKLARVGDRLKGGRVIHTSSKEALYIPAGCIYAVFTICGGFLATIDCTTVRSIWPFSSYLKYGLHRTQDTEAERQCLCLFLDCLEVALLNGGVSEAVRGWLKVADIMQKLARDDRKWRHSASKIWKSFLRNTQPGKW